MATPLSLGIPSWLGVSLVLSIFGLLLAVLVIVRRKWNVHPEVPRKCAHVVMGLLLLALPWLFDSVLPATVLAILSIMSLLLLRWAACRNCEVGRILHWSAQRRRSIGDLSFPVSVLALFYLASDEPLLYCLPILYLTLSDSMACLVGMRYSTSKPGAKSMEGSIAFFLTTFLLTLAGMLAYAGAALAPAVLVALIMGSSLTIVEAIAFRGLDNLTVPLAGYLVLNCTMAWDSSRLIPLTGLCVLVACGSQLWQLWTKDTSGPMVRIERFMTFVFSESGGDGSRRLL
ncbi:MAG: hypothetical protein IT365_16825 [Candidatus Hydrogenedentes bacterium]|nr:hypothetical protein [Candidatus Hydrogenedentota bacterium]